MLTAIKLIAKKDMQSLRKVLAEIINERGLARKINEQRAILTWDEVVGRTVGQNARPIRIIDGTLFVNVTNSVWAHQLSFFARSYASNINRRLNDEVVKEIRFSIGKIESENESDLKREEEKAEVSLEQIALDREQLNNIEETLKNIEDLELRDRLRLIMICQKKLSILRGQSKD